MACGPNRAPVRNGDPLSEGKPRTATSRPSALAACGKRMNVATPQKRGRARLSKGRSISVMDASNQAVMGVGRVAQDTVDRRHVLRAGGEHQPKCHLRPQRHPVAGA